MAVYIDTGDITATLAKITALLAALQTSDSQLSTTLGGIVGTQTQQTATLNKILGEVSPPPKRATKIALEIPTRTKRGIAMPNYELPNDEVVTVTIKTTDSSGAVEPVPAGDVFSATNSLPASLNSVIGTDASGNPALVLNGLVQASPNITVTVSDSAGLMAATLVVDIVPDVTPTNIILDVADATHTTQPVPTAPGP